MKNLLISFIIILLLCGCHKQNIELHFLNIGKADCIVAKTKSKSILIDTGLDSSSPYILEYLKKNNIKKIDILILTHFDIDHVGGADKIIKSIPVKQIYMPNYNEVNDEYFELINTINSYHISYDIINKPLSLIFNSIIYDIYPSTTYNYQNEEDNNISLITKITDKQTSFLLTGDIEEERILKILDEKYLKSSLIKIPHHGSDNLHNLDFLKLVNPKWAIITSNINKTKINNYLDTLNINFLYTSNGDVICTSNGYKLHCKQN